MATAPSAEFYDEAYFLGTSGSRGNFSLLELGPKFYDRTQTVVDYFDLANRGPGLVVEAGCGTAPFCRIVRQNSALSHIEVVASDITKSGVDLLHPDEKPQFTPGQADDLPFATASLIGVVEWDVLEHLNNPTQAISEAHRVLQPGGFFHIVCPNPDSWLRDSSNADEDPYRRDLSHVFPPIVTTGFVEEALRTVGFETEVFTRGFETGVEGQHQIGITAMKLVQEDRSGSHIVAFARKV